MRVPITISLYHLLLVAGGLYLAAMPASILVKFPPVWVNSALFGLVGGCAYCIKSTYHQYCVKEEWGSRWILWHIFRPYVSAICGAVSFLFVKAGLLLFGASIDEQNYYGVYSLAFVAGLNVDNFIKKIESLFEEIIGIRKSNLSKNNPKEETK